MADKTIEQEHPFMKKDPFRFRWYHGVLIYAFILLISLVWAYWYEYKQEMIANTVLDQINLYEVTVEPLEDGSLQVTYALEWEVLDSFWDGPLTWVKIGVPDKNFRIADYGSAAIEASAYEETWIRLDLDRRYKKGETASFWVTAVLDKVASPAHSPEQEKDMQDAVQAAVLSEDYASLVTYTLNPDQYHYRFTPGWFDGIEVLSYRFRWKQSPYSFDPSPEAEIHDGYYLWTGALGPGERRNLSLYYNARAFGEDGIHFSNTKMGSLTGMTFGNNYSTNSGLSMDAPTVVWYIIGMSAVFGFRMLLGGYRHGRGFRGGPGRRRWRLCLRPELRLCQKLCGRRPCRMQPEGFL